MWVKLLIGSPLRSNTPNVLRMNCASAFGSSIALCIRIMLFTHICLQAWSCNGLGTRYHVFYG
jgi:hypothetical protein